jgi:mRNA-degrading endonuclease toxin of MazEF toxin-antitoxin module
VLLPRGIAGNAADREVMVDQSRALDDRRLRRALGILPAPILRELKAKLRQLGDL